MIFKRTLPDALQALVSNGESHVAGNLIKDGATGKIQGQLIPLTTEGALALKHVTPVLCAATLAMQGINLLVTIRGFRKVGRQLEQIDAQLRGIDDQIKHVLEKQEQALFEMSVQRQSRLLAGVRSLERGLRLGSDVAFWQGLQAVDETADYNCLLCKALLAPAETIYRTAETLSKPLEAVVSYRAASAHALANRCQWEEAQGVLCETVVWVHDLQASFEAPFNEDMPPAWLGDLSGDDRQSVKALVPRFRQYRAGLGMLQRMYSLCMDTNLTVDELVAKGGEDGYLVALPEDGDTNDETETSPSMG